MRNANARTHCPYCKSQAVKDLAYVLRIPGVDLFQCHTCLEIWHVPKDQNWPPGRDLLGPVKLEGWRKRTRLQPVQFEWEEEPQLRTVRLVSKSAQVGDPVRVTVAGVEVEGRIEAVGSSTLHVRIGRRLF